MSRTAGDRGPVPGQETIQETAEHSELVSAWQRFLHRVPNGFAIFFGLLGLFCALTSLILPLRRAARPVVYGLSVLTVPTAANLAYAVFLLLLATAMAARKRVALWFVLGYLALLLLADALLLAVGYWDIIPSLAVCAVALTVLVLARREFYAASRRGAFLRALLVLVAGLAVAIVIGWGLVSLFPGSLERGGGNRLLFAANKVCGGLVGGRHFAGHPPHWVYFLLGLLGALALLNAAMTLFRSQRLVAALHDDEELRIRTLLGHYGGRDSLGYFATRRDKAVVFSPSGKAAVTYRVEAGVCLASGDPLGDPESWAPAIDAWLSLAGRYGWQPAVMGGPARTAPGPTPGRAWAPSSWATRPSSRSPPSTSKAARCGSPARPSTASSARARPPASAATPHSPTRRWARSSGARTPGATPRPSAASRWRWGAWAIRPTATACSSRPSTATET
ncbi:hypothetical protein GCM10020000_10370 [Streptomyces olivoverticillatus]